MTTLILDLAAADQHMLSYKRKLMTRSDLVLVLRDECNVPHHLIEQAIAEVDATSLQQLEQEIEG